MRALPVDLRSERRERFVNGMDEAFSLSLMRCLENVKLLRSLESSSCLGHVWNSSRNGELR